MDTVGEVQEPRTKTSPYFMATWTEITTINGKRCKGHCCERFYLPFSPEELAKYVEDKEHLTHRYNNEEVAQVAGMVEYLGASKLDANKEIPYYAKQNSDYLNHWYRCKNHNTETGDCMIYETRPPMCRGFPYEGECEYHACASHPWWRHYRATRWIARNIFRWLPEREAKYKGKKKRLAVVEELCYNKLKDENDPRHGAEGNPKGEINE